MSKSEDPFAVTIAQFEAMTEEEQLQTCQQVLKQCAGLVAKFITSELYAAICLAGSPRCYRFSFGWSQFPDIDPDELEQIMDRERIQKRPMFIIFRDQDELICKTLTRGCEAVRYNPEQLPSERQVGWDWSRVKEETA